MSRKVTLVAGFLCLGIIILFDNLNGQEVDSVGKVKNSVVLIQTPHGCGTGTIILREGIILTAYHIIQGHEDDTLLVHIRRAGIFKAIFIFKYDIDMTSLLKTALTSDIALLRLLKPFPELTIAMLDSINLREGDDLYFYGYPLCGSEKAKVPSLRKGLLSQFYTFDTSMGKIHPFKIDGILNPGNSGGPIIDPVSGNVIGMILAVRLKFPELKNKHLVTIEGDTIGLDEFQPISGIGYGLSVEPIVHVVREFQNKRR